MQKKGLERRRGSIQGSYRYQLPRECDDTQSFHHVLDTEGPAAVGSEPAHADHKFL